MAAILSRLQCVDIPSNRRQVACLIFRAYIITKPGNPRWFLRWVFTTEKLTPIILHTIYSYYVPAPPKMEWGCTGFTAMSVRPYVRPSVDKVSGTFWKKKKKKTIGSIHFIPGIYSYGVSLLTPIHFRVPSLIFGPLVAKYLAENGVSGTF